jgi:hypothetical protein
MGPFQRLTLSRGLGTRLEALSASRARDAASGTTRRRLACAVGRGPLPYDHNGSAGTHRRSQLSSAQLSLHGMIRPFRLTDSVHIEPGKVAVALQWKH